VRSDIPVMLRAGHVISLCVLALLGLGVVMVASAGMSVRPIPLPGQASGSPGDPSGVWGMLISIVFSQSTVYLLLSVAAMAAASMTPVRRLAAWAEREHNPLGAMGQGARSAGLGDLVLLGAACGAFLLLLSLVYVPGVGKEVNGSARWIRMGFNSLSFQPSEIVKWGLVIVLPWYGARRAAEMPSFARGLAPGLAAAGLVAGAVVLEDLGTGALIGLVACIVLLAAGATWWHFAAFVPAAVAGLIGAIWVSPYRIKRLTAFLDPYADPQGAGYHMIQSMAAVAGGEGPGRGLGHGLQKFGYLPEDKTDFLFAVICEELGIVGAAIVIALFVALIWAALAVIRREQSVMLKLVGLGVTATVAIQALINMVVVTGLGPTKGIALPLVSSGGTGWVLTAASLGLLVAMDRAQMWDESRVDRESAIPSGAPEGLGA
jgi:cell division protein FtsW